MLGASWPSGRIRLLCQASEGCLGVIGIEHGTPGPVGRVGEWGDLGQASALAGLQLTAHRLDVRDQREQTDEVIGIPRGVSRVPRSDLERDCAWERGYREGTRTDADDVDLDRGPVASALEPPGIAVVVAGGIVVR